MRNSRGTSVVVAALALSATGLLGCPSPMEPPPPPEEPMIAAPEAPRIPWLAAGTPDITPPQIPWLTDESACPEGWAWTELSPGLNGCDPYPTGYIEDCGPTGAHFPGEAGCRDLDSGDTEWPSDLPATNVLYVREGASGGDGTRALPFATLPEALAAAIEGTTIALAPGRYDTGQGMERADVGGGVFETLSRVRTNGVHIRGTSVARTTLFSTRPAPTTVDFAMLQVESSRVEISDLRFESPHPAIDAFGGELVAQRVVLDGTFGGLVTGAGGTAVFEDVIARGWSGLPAVTSAGAAHVSLRRAVLSRSPAFAVASDGLGSSAVVEDLAVIEGGSALVAGGGGVLDATHVAVVAPSAASIAHAEGRIHARWMRIERTPPFVTGLFASNGALEVEDLIAEHPVAGDASMVGCLAGAAVTLSRGVLWNTTVVAEGSVGLSDLLFVGGGDSIEGRGDAAEVTLERIEISGGSGVGVIAQTDASVRARDLSIRDMTAPTAYAVYAEQATLSVERASFANVQVGAVAWRGADVSLTDVSIHDVSTLTADESTAAVLAVGSVVSATRVSIERVEGSGVASFESGHAVRLEDVSIRRAEGPPGNSRGIAIFGEGASSTLDRVEVADARGFGVLANSPTEISDLVVRGVEVDTDDSFGFGFFAASTAAVTGARLLVQDVAAVGLVVARRPDSPSPPRVTWSDVRIERVGSDVTGGAAVLASGEVDLSLTGFVLRDTASVGVMSQAGANVTLTNGLIVGPITCTSSDSTLDLTTVETHACGSAPVTWTPPEL